MSREAGPDLVFFIHGLGCSRNNFLDAWSAAGLETYSLAALDLPGFGESPMVEGFSCDMEEFAEICDRVLSLFPHRRIHLVGHSMGGAIALLLADRIGERLSSFVNVEGNLTGRDCTTSRRRASVSYENFVAYQLPALILSTALSDEPGRKMWSRFIRMADKKALYRSSQSLVQWSDSGLLLKKFKDLECRKVYLYGEKNSFFEISSLLGDIRSIAISRSGHFPMNDNADEFYRCLADFIRQPGS
jgi:pimeloyl-ACP methyl ester carboxylesterase